MPAPWNEQQLQTEMVAANGHGWVLEEAGAIVGYAFFRTCEPECELLHVVVAPEKRRRGAGEALVRQALGQLAAAGCSRCLLEVRESNTAGRQLYEKMGFSQVGRRKKYYRQPTEDALLMDRDMIESVI